MVEYRRFQNSDPPAIRRLWQTCGLGRGAAFACDQDAFETTVFSQPYFDRDGVIFAIDEGRVVGYAHAGFGCNADGSALDHQLGSICAVMVEPSHRRRGIGRELVRLAETYLKERGALQLTAGPAEPVDAFYFGIYGGSQPAGFLDSDPLAAPFFQSLGYQPEQRQLVFQRDLGSSRDPIGLRLMAVRRSTKLMTPLLAKSQSWWWCTRAGRLDSIELCLSPKAGGDPCASVTIVGLDAYLPQTGSRDIGLLDLHVPEHQRRKGYGQALLVELCRRMREEMVGLVEAHAAADDAPTIGVLKSAGFIQVDAGTVFRAPQTPT